ncbi:MAG: nucleotide exchange factor GrpE [Armatimonadota bacterium]
MADKRKIPINSDIPGDMGSPSQEQKDNELADTGVVPDEVFRESPEGSDIVTESSEDNVITEDIQYLLDRCKAAEERADAEHENFLRTLADFNNFRRRSKEELDQARKYGIEGLVVRLLPILDNFERALKAADEIKDFNALHGGVVLILKQLSDVLEREGVKTIETKDQIFDPNIHEAVMREDTDEYPDGAIIEEFQKGFMLGDRVVRASMVKVAHHTD